jgi:hypothetical protein
MTSTDQLGNSPSDNLESPKKNKTFGQILRWVIAGVLIITAAIGIWYGWIYYQTPPNVRMPKSAHYHFRLQIINNGQPVNFASDAFQTPYDKFSCSVNLPAEPIHFHDNLDQFVHIHWKGVTGGMLLKQYGWNEIGGRNSTLGYRFDQGRWPKPVKTHGNILPKRPDSANYYLYIGDQTQHQPKNWQDFLHQDLEIFFENSLVANATETTSTAGLDQNFDPNLILLNHLVGNAVLFIQKDQPTEEQVQKYFNQLIPLPQSTCGG